MSGSHSRLFHRQPIVGKETSRINARDRGPNANLGKGQQAGTGNWVQGQKDLLWNTNLAATLRGLSPCLQSRDRPAGFYDALGDGIAGEPGDVVDAQPVHESLAMPLDSLDAEVQFSGDLLVGFAFGDQLQDFRLAGGQQVGSLSHRHAFDDRVAITVHESFGNGGTENGAALAGFADCFDQVGDDRLFHQVARRACFGQLMHVFVVAV